MKTVTLSLPDLLAASIERDFAFHGYADVSGYVVDVLQAQQEREGETLRKLLLEGSKSGEPIPATPQFWADLRGETDALLAENQLDMKSAPAA